MADDLEFPRWEHHDEFKSELVNDEQQREALFKRWERGEGRPKSAAPFRPVRPVAPVEIVPPPPPPAPTFTVYDIGIDEDVPLTQDRLDKLLLAEHVISLLWPAIRHDREAEPGQAFPPETAKAIETVTELLANAAADSEPTAEASPSPAPKRRGRPPKPKPEAP